MKSLNISLLIIVIGFQSIVFSNQANSSELCFSSIPDSAWVNGEPEEVKMGLNFDLVGTSKILTPVSEPPSFLNVLSQGSSNLKVQTEYEYKGRNCQTRTVKVNKNINGPVLEFADRAKFESEINRRSSNFIQAQETIKYVDGLINFLNSSSIYQINYDETLNTRSIYQKFYASSGSRSERTQSIVLSSSARECFFESTPISSRIFAVADGTKFGAPSSQIRFTGKNCNLEVYFYFPNYFNRSTGKTEPNSELLFKLGKFSIDRKPEETTIYCLNKSKKTIQLTGANPKCPKGFKLKK